MKGEDVGVDRPGGTDHLEVSRLDVARGATPGRGLHTIDPLRAEVDLLRVEADLLHAESDPLHAASVLIVSAGYAPERTGVAPHATALARDLATVAERVVVLTSEPAPHQPAHAARAGTGRSILDGVSRMTQLGRPGPRRTFGHDRGVHLIRHRHHALAPLPGAAAVSWSERSFLRAVLATGVRHPPNLVIGLMPTAASATAAARLAQRFSAPLVLLVQDMPGAGSPGLPPGSALGRGQLEALRQASRVVVLSNRLRAVMVAQSVAQERIELLPDWTPDRPQALAPPTARARLGVAQDGFAVVHIGNMGPVQDLETLVAAARLLARQRSTTAHVLLVGEGSSRPQLELACADLPIVRFLDPVTSEHYPALLAAADVLVVTERPGTADRSLPSRIRSYLAAGRPIVAAVNPGGDADLALRAAGGTVVFAPPGDPRALAAELERLRTARSRPSVATRFDLDVEAGEPGAGVRATRRLRDVVRTVLTESAGRPRR